MSQEKQYNSNDIAQKQNEPRFISMLAAQRQLYTEEKRYNSFLFGLSFLSAIAIPLLLYFEPSISQFWGLIGLGVYFVNRQLSSAMKEKRTKASKIQEEFDTELFGLEWNKALAEKRISPEIIVAADKRYKNDRSKLAGWYSSPKHGLPHRYTILFCMRENFVWDYRQRQSYVRLLSAFFVVISVGALGLGIVYQVLLPTFLLAYVAPLMPLLGLIADAWLSHRKTAEGLQQKADEITELLLSASATEDNISDDKLRGYQDTVFKNRQSGLPVPDWFYNSLGKRISEEVAQSTESIINNLGIKPSAI